MKRNYFDIFKKIIPWSFSFFFLYKKLSVSLEDLICLLNMRKYKVSIALLDNLVQMHRDSRSKILSSRHMEQV